MNIRPFEIALIGIFAVAGIIGLFTLSHYKGSPTPDQTLFGSEVMIWGTLDSGIMDNFLVEQAHANKAFEVVKYRQIDARSFDSEFVNAVAEGRSPDLVIMSQKELVSYRAKLLPISYTTLPERTFRDTYIDGAEIYMRSDGIYGIPFAVDPLVMYWNRDLFSSSGLAQPPKTWETLVSQTTKAITRTTDALEITQSAVAFGEYANVAHAKEVLSMLFFQAGSTLVEENSNGYIVTLNKSVNQSTLAPGDAVLTFYTQFATPSKDTYSWNRSKNLDRTEFVNGDLGMYFGLGSEIKMIERENPNLNFDVAPVPQGSGVTVQRNYGDFYAFAIPRASKNATGAYAVATTLAGSQTAKTLVDAFDFAPVLRTLYDGSETDALKKIVYQSGLIARSWLDPYPSESNIVFRKMVEDVTSGRVRLENVIIDAVHGLESLF